MGTRDPYDVLEVPRDADAEAIKRAFKRAALTTHPDKPGGSAEKFTEANDAYALLSDPGRKEQFDRFGIRDPGPPPHQGGGHMPPDLAELLRMFNMGPQGGGGFPGGGTGFPGGGGGVFMMGNMGPMGFKHVFGPHGAQSGHGAQGRVKQVLEIPLSARDIYSGCAKVISFDARDECGSCRPPGSGAVAPEDLVTCQTCFGSGCGCPGCGGVGRSFRVARRCAGCGGVGTIACKRSFEARVPPGVPDGLRQLMSCRGAWDPKTRRNGEIELLFRAPFPEGHTLDPATGDVTVRVPIDLAEVLCGFHDGKRRVDAFGGACPVDVAAEAYISPVRVVEFPGRGLPPASQPGGSVRGALRVAFDVTWPSDEDGTLAKLKDVFQGAFRKSSSKTRLRPDGGA